MYYVFVPGGREPRFIHDTYGEAESEAQRLVGSEGCGEAVICQIVSVARAQVKMDTPDQWRRRSRGEYTEPEGPVVPVAEVLALIEEVKNKKKRGRPKKVTEADERDALVKTALDAIKAVTKSSVLDDDENPL